VIVAPRADDLVAHSDRPAGAATDEECNSINFCPNAAGLEQKIAKTRKNCKKRTKIDAKIAKNARKRRQIVENGVDQIDLGGVGENPETK
jgi:hypothetical protein